MPTPKLTFLVLAVLLAGACPAAHAQSPYGLAARQTIPFVIDQTVQAPGGGQVSVWNTELSVHNPGPLAITAAVTYLGAVATATPGRVSCQSVVVQPGATFQGQFGVLCPLNPGLSYGRLELSALAPSATTADDPAADLFLANARVARPPAEYFTVEGFPQGNLSGNKSFAAVTGLKNGSIGNHQWVTACFAAALNEPSPVFVRLVDGNGAPVGAFASAALNPPVIEMQTFADVFTAVGAAGNFDNVTALFSTAAQGGVGGAGIVAFCRIVDLTTGHAAFGVAKYLDNHDEGRQHHTDVSETSWGSQFAVLAEVDENDKTDESNLHVAYFQHPDRVRCEVRFLNPDIPFFDLGQVRLIDPDGTVVAGGPHQTFFQADLGEKSTRHNGRNGRWLIEVGPDRTLKMTCGHGLSLCSGGASFTTYTVSCSSGNGHNQLDIVGHCAMGCLPDKSQKGNKYFLCAFDMPFLPSRCRY